MRHITGRLTIRCEEETAIILGQRSTYLRTVAAARNVRQISKATETWERLERERESDFDPPFSLQSPFLELLIQRRTICHYAPMAAPEAFYVRSHCTLSCGADS
jgi:hypothetical protein